MKYRNVIPDRSVISSRSSQGFPWDLTSRRNTNKAEWTPTLDVYRRDNHFVIEVDLPSVSRENISLDLEQNRLTLKGHREEDTPRSEGSEDEESSRTYYRRKRSRGPFRRTFTLPDGFDEESVSARLNDGVLTIEMILKSSTTRNIEVDGASEPASVESGGTESMEDSQDWKEKN